jgi:error-prone DNA polymerase
MGFYAPHTLVDDAKRHGVEVRPVDVNASRWDCTLEEGALRLGMRLVKGLRQETAKKIESAREGGEQRQTRSRSFEDIGDVARRARVPRHELVRLAMANALASLNPLRRQALWEIQALAPLAEEDLFFGQPMDETKVDLPRMSAAERVSADYESVGLSLEQHPIKLLRKQLTRKGAVAARDLIKIKSGRRVSVGGMVICRQRPGTAKGFCFISLEDETGISNLVIEPHMFDRFRREIIGSVLLFAEGAIEKTGKVVNVKVHRLSPLLLERAA